MGRGGHLRDFFLSTLIKAPFPKSISLNSIAEDARFCAFYEAVRAETWQGEERDEEGKAGLKTRNTVHHRRLSSSRGSASKMSR